MTWRASTFKLEFSEVDFVAVFSELIGLGATDFGDHAADVLQLFLYFSASGHVISVDMRVHCKNTIEPVADPGFPRILLSLGQKPIIYRPKVLFPQVFVCPQVGRGGSMFSQVFFCSRRGVSIQGGLCPVGSLFDGVSVQGRSLSGEVSGGGLCPGEGYPLTVKSGRYASYWNAFLCD